MTHASPVRDRRAERHQATRQEILEAAWGLARERGLTGWSLRDLSEAVGMRAPSLYVYFDSKAALYDTLYAQGYADLLARSDALPVEGPPEALLRQGARMFFDFCVEDPARHQLMFLRTIPGFEPSPESYAVAEAALDRLRDVLRAAGMGSPETLDLWTAVLAGLAAQQISNDPGGDRWSRLVDRAVDLLLRQGATSG